MTTRLHRPLLAGVLALLVLLPFSAPAAAAKPSPSERRKEILAMRDEVLKELGKLDPAARSRLRKAEGYAVFSNVGVNLIFASAGGGTGVVVENGLVSDTETYMRMATLGLGIGLGVKDFRAVFIFHDKEALKNFIEKGWDFSGQADAAAKSDKKGAAAGLAGTAIPGVEVIQITKNGVALQATLQGTKYWQDRDLN
jgi:lipid-binding SYLF domain-containing protein